MGMMTHRTRVLTVCAVFATLACGHAQSVDTPQPGSAFVESYRAALIAYKNGDYKTARAEAQKAETLQPKDAKLKLLLGRIALELGEAPAAEKLVKEGIAADPQYPYAYQYLGDVYFRQRQFIPALDAYGAFLKLKPKDPDGVLKTVYCHVGRNDLAEAGKALLQLDQFSDIHPGYYFAKAAIAQAGGKKEAVDKELQLARTMYGNETFALYMKTYLELFPPHKAADETK